MKMVMTTQHAASEVGRYNTAEFWSNSVYDECGMMLFHFPELGLSSFSNQPLPPPPLSSHSLPIPPTYLTNESFLSQPSDPSTAQ